MRERTLEDNRNALYFDYSGSYMIHLCQNTSNIYDTLVSNTFKRVNYTICKLYINKPNLKKSIQTFKGF